MFIRYLFLFLLLLACLLGLGYEFFNRTGDLDSAAKVLEKWLGLSGAENRTAETAAALGNLGILYRSQGELGRVPPKLTVGWRGPGFGAE